MVSLSQGVTPLTRLQNRTCQEYQLSARFPLHGSGRGSVDAKASDFDSLNGDDSHRGDALLSSLLRKSEGHNERICRSAVSRGWLSRERDRDSSGVFCPNRASLHYDATIR